MPLVSIQSSSPAQCIDDCDPSIEEYNHHPRFLGHSLTKHNSLQPNEAPTHTVSTTSAGVRQFRSNSDTNQLPCAFHDQPPALLLLDPDDITRADVGFGLPFDTERPLSRLNADFVHPTHAALLLDIPLDDERPPSPFNIGSVHPAHAALSLDIPLDDETPASPFNTGLVPSAHSALSLDIPLDDEMPASPFSTGFVHPAHAALSLDVPLDDERPLSPFNTGFVHPSHLALSLDIPLDDERPPSPFNTGFVPPAHATLSLNVPFDHKQPSSGPLNHGSLHIGTCHTKRVTNTLSSCYGTPRDPAVQLYSLSLFS